MRRILLVSTSTVHGTGYLDHCKDEALRLFDGLRRVLFVPWALGDREAYAAAARERFRSMGLELDSLHEAGDPPAAVDAAEGIFIGGGNTFRLVNELHSRKVIEPIRRKVGGGMPYMGTSAGSNVACPTLKTTNDMPIVRPPSFDTLNLVPFQINPHYIDPDPESAHMGETRDVRIAEFHEENTTPVVALREGAMLRITGDSMRLVGEPGGKLFRRGSEPAPIAAGAGLDFLLTSE